MYRKLPQAPRNLYQDLFERLDDGDYSKDYGRVTFHPRAGEEANQARTTQ